jgi:hypothetical protein
MLASGTLMKDIDALPVTFLRSVDSSLAPSMTKAHPHSERSQAPHALASKPSRSIPAACDGSRRATGLKMIEEMIAEGEGLRKAIGNGHRIDAHRLAVTKSPALRREVTAEEHVLPEE